MFKYMGETYSGESIGEISNSLKPLYLDSSFQKKIYIGDWEIFTQNNTQWKDSKVRKTVELTQNYL